MGIVRLLLALSVLIFHAGKFFNYNIVNNTIAVFSFFIISGFYMALVLDKKYSKQQSKLLFWGNRFLRIFPLYWLSLLVVFLFVLVKFVFHIGTDDNAIVHYGKYSLHSSSLLFYTDLFNYIVRNITLIGTIDYFRVNDNTPGYLLVQQAWTLQIELLFYVIAPYLNQLSKKIFIVFFLVYVVSFFGFIAPLHLLPPNLGYIFLNNLVFFLLGMMSYRFLYSWLQTKKMHFSVTRGVFIFLILYLLLYHVISFKYQIFNVSLNDILYYSIFLFSMPFIFLQTSVSVIDSYIGKFSYPVYITHFIVIKLLSNISLFKQDSNIKTILIITLTFFISLLAIKFIEIPIDRIRQKRIKPLK